MYMCVCVHTCTSCLTLCNPMDRNPPGFSVYGLFPGKNTGVDCHFLLQGIFLTQGLNPHLLCLPLWQADSLSLTPPDFRKHLRKSPTDKWRVQTASPGRRHKTRVSQVQLSRLSCITITPTSKSHSKEGQLHRTLPPQNSEGSTRCSST